MYTKGPKAWNRCIRCLCTNTTHEHAKSSVHQARDRAYWEDSTSLLPSFPVSLMIESDECMVYLFISVATPGYNRYGDNVPPCVVREVVDNESYEQFLYSRFVG